MIATGTLCMESFPVIRHEAITKKGFGLACVASADEALPGPHNAPRLETLHVPPPCHFTHYESGYDVCLGL